jgi:hypothetical protein
MLLVDGQSGFAVATERPDTGTFGADGDRFLGRLPGMYVANTALAWRGRRWSTLNLPLPDDRFVRIRLLAHEAFHRIQPELGLERPDRLNPHLDEREGRYLLRLELRALARALTTSGSARRRSVVDALTFRARRAELFPGADSLETSLELQEGLAEYTGTRVALRETGQGMERVAREMAGFEGRPSYVRALGYGTGPALGLLLDGFRPGWRRVVARTSLAGLLRSAIGFVPPADLAAAVQARAPDYDGAVLAGEEDRRAEERAARAVAFRARLVDGPVVILRGNGLRRSFNPNNLFPLADLGTVYPTGSFESDWGALELTGAPALVSADFGEVRVPGGPDVVARSGTVEGPGWKLDLGPGWTLEPGARSGDLQVRRP